MRSDLKSFFLTSIVPPPRVNPSKRERKGSRFSGAAISGKSLVLVTVTRDPTGHIRLREKDIALFTLAGRDQASTLSFFVAVKRHCTTGRIRRIALRAGAESGSYTASPMSYVIEGLINLVDRLTIVLFHVHSVDRWRRAESHNAPALPPSVPRARRYQYDHALAAACLAASQASEN